MVYDFADFGRYSTAFAAVSYVACCGALISSAEYLAIRHEFRPDGFYSWKVMSSRPEYIAHAGVLSRLDFLFGYRGFTLLNAVRALCSIGAAVLVAARIEGAAPLFWLLALSAAVISYRNMVGCDGSDQMSLLVFTSLAIAASTHDKFVQNASLGFIAIQSILSYVVSGVAKAMSAKWRSGVALRQIMNTRTYGLLPVARWLESQPHWLNVAICWSVILVETGFILVPFLPAPLALTFLAWGVLFHVGNAIAMGLNNFFWSFTATYPAILYLHHLIRNWG